MHISDVTHTLNIVVFMIYCFVSIRMLILGTIRIINDKWHVFLDMYAFTLIVVQVLNIISIVYFMQKLSATDQMLQDLRHYKRTEYFLYSHAMHIQNKFHLTVSCMLFLSIFLLLEFMKFITWTVPSVRALKYAFLSLFMLSLGVLFVIISFGVVGRLLFAATFEEFLVFAFGPMMCLRMISRLGRTVNWNRLWEHEGGIVILMYITYYLISWMFRLSFVVLCIRAFNHGKVITADDIYGYTLVDYVTEKAQALWIRLTGR